MITIMIDPNREFSWLMIVDDDLVVNDAREDNDYIVAEIESYKMSKPKVIVGSGYLGCDFMAGRTFQTCENHGIDFYMKDKYDLLEEMHKLRQPKHSKEVTREQ